MEQSNHAVYGVYLYFTDQLAWCQDDRRFYDDNGRADTVTRILYEYSDELDDAFDGICYDDTEYCQCRACHRGIK